MAMDMEATVQTNFGGLVPHEEVIQDNCCQCGDAFDVRWDAWSGMYAYLYEWEQYTVFCSGKCMELFEQNLCHDCNHPRTLCFHALMASYDYAEAMDEEAEKYDNNDTWAYRELYAEQGK